MTDLAERLRALADLVPILEAPDADFGDWAKPALVDGVRQMPYFVSGPTADAWRDAVARGGWIMMGFDWSAWMRGDEGARFRDRPETVAAANVDDLARLLTAIVRSERFSEGSIAGAFESGLLARIARRAATLEAELTKSD